MAESLHAAGEFIAKHKVALGVGGAAIVLWLILRGGGSSSAASAGGGSSLQIAQLQSAQNLQMAQLQAQQNSQTLGAQVQQNQNTDALQAEQDQLAAQVTGQAFAYKAQSDQTTAQAALYKDLIDTGAAEQEAQLTAQTSLAKTLIPGLNSQHYGATNLNALALIEGQGNIGSFNAATSSEQIASTLSKASIIKSITNGAGAALGGIFG